MSVVVAPYSDAWPDCFRTLRDELLGVFAQRAVAIEHIGSTSVPGLAAKPVIDVLLGAPSLAMIEAHIDRLDASGYAYVAKYERDIPMRRYFVKAAAHAPRVHLHAVESGGRIWREHLAFRDALRGDDGLRARYQALKLDLADRFAHDKAAYTAAKSPFVAEVLRRFLD